MKRTPHGLVVLAALLLAFTGCAGSEAPEQALVAEEGADVADEGSEDPQGTSDKNDAEKPKDPDRDRKKGSSEKRGEAANENDSDSQASDQPADSPADEGAPDGGPDAALSPAAGSYVYAQRGYEEFCSGASCDRSDLPNRQALDLRLLSRSGAGDEVLSEIKGPGDRLVQTTTVYDDAVASVTRVYLRMAYEGFVFENEYQPAPPVQILHFPLRTGDSWSGSWKADTSGTYRAKVVGSENISVGGRSVQTFKVSTATTFRGEFEGTSDAQVWVDPKTRAVLKTSGLLRLKTNLGGYNTAFQTDLLSGPGY